MHTTWSVCLKNILSDQIPHALFSQPSPTGPQPGPPPGSAPPTATPTVVNHPGGVNSKITVIEALDRIKDELGYLQAQNQS